MLDTLKLAGAILGGLGLFLLAIGMMTDGLKHGAGSALRRLLSDWCRTPLRGLFTGFFITAVVQSSSAVTVASLGFVNAGLINLRQALGIIYGTNVGTTITGWLVAIVGFRFNIQTFALPIIGFGMAMKVVKRRGRLASVGLALVGFGLFFIGLDILKNAFDGVVQAFDISRFTADGISGIIKFLLIGVVMTTLTQSSSASIALTITAASSDIVGVYAAGAMVIGANVGTSSTALLASIGATSPAKRLAAAQVIFNAATALVALTILPILFYLIDSFSSFFGLTANPAISLALFHTLFNLLGVLLIYPHNNRFAAFLENRFHTWEEEASHPRFLDKTIASTPVLAVNALILEIQSISEKVISIYAKAISPTTWQSKALEDAIEVLKSLSREVSNFIVSIESTSLSEEITMNLASLMRAEQYFLSCTLCVERIADQLASREKFHNASLEAGTVLYFQNVLDFMNASRLDGFGSAESFIDRFNGLQAEHDELKSNLILEATRSHISVAQMSETIDCLAESLRLNQQWFKGITRLKKIQQVLVSSDASYPETVVQT